MAAAAERCADVMLTGLSAASNAGSEGPAATSSAESSFFSPLLIENNVKTSVG